MAGLRFVHNTPRLDWTGTFADGVSADMQLSRENLLWLWCVAGYKGTQWDAYGGPGFTAVYTGTYPGYSAVTLGYQGPETLQLQYLFTWVPGLEGEVLSAVTFRSYQGVDFEDLVGPDDNLELLASAPDYRMDCPDPTRIVQDDLRLVRENLLYLMGAAGLQALSNAKPHYAGGGAGRDYENHRLPGHATAVVRSGDVHDVTLTDTSTVADSPRFRTSIQTAPFTPDDAEPALDAPFSVRFFFRRDDQQPEYALVRHVVHVDGGTLHDGAGHDGLDDAAGR